MYPFTHLQSAYDQLWAAVRAHLHAAPDELDRSIDLATAWHSPDLLLGQTCGWPLITQLSDVVEVVGAFDVRAPFAAEGRYRSVIVGNKPFSVTQWRADPNTVVAFNSSESLSGWISMCHVWGGVPARTLQTGSHVESMRAVADGRAHLASIDALSFEFAVAVDAMLSGRLHIIGHGPTVPSLPLVMSRSLATRRDEVRAALAAAVVAPEAAEACVRLRIGGFVPLTSSDYEELRALAPRPAR
jgi:ABC-type phosphate/phosphonate transport system substrate-binding protein